MDNISNLLQEIAITSFEVGSSCWVDVTHINNPHHFYVRPRAYSMYLQGLQARGEHFDARDICLGQIVVYKSKLQKTYLRGRVLMIHGEGAESRYKLYAMDVGCIESGVRLKRVWKRKNESSVPSLVTLCQLANCGPIGVRWEDTNIAEAMWNYVKGERARMIIVNVVSDRLIVELYNSCPDDIATMLALTGFTTLGYVHNSQNEE
ncbi:uncharacterized protein [Epargyreus clarus]|uniref:uncharacterized protein n=1 Tax=Epargyreus clarus TaxID=520877 RepID=UPI003C2C5276